MADRHGRHRVPRRRGASRRGVFLGVLAALIWYDLAGFEAVAANGGIPMVDAEVRQALTAGRARVLVEVRVPGGMRAEGVLGEAGAGSQQAAIAAAQGQVLSRLPAAHFSLVRRYETIPFLALEIDAAGVQALERMGDVVTRVLPDRAVAPAVRPGGRP